MPGKRRRLNLFAIVFNIFLPWFLIIGVMSILTFAIHYQRPRTHSYYDTLHLQKFSLRNTKYDPKRPI